MFTTVCFHEVINLGGFEQNLAGLPDQHKKVVGDQIFIDNFNLIVGARAILGTVPTQARLVSPSLRRVNPHQIHPIEAGLAPVFPSWYNLQPQQAIPLETNEGLEAVVNATGGAGETPAVIVWLADKPIQPVTGNMRRIRFTTRLVLGANIYSYGEIDFVDELPVGTYKCVGGALVDATGILFRFVPMGGMNRPGNACSVTLTNDLVAGGVGWGLMGEWFSFSTLSPPGIEILDSAGAGIATYTGFMDILL